jgi:8-oxo-dGTP pyrophosphatase MutT (NUDIX family)
MSDQYANPWRTLSTRQVYENPWIEVREDQVLRPDGEPGIYGVVHMRNTAIGVLPIDDEDHTYLVGQFRYTTNTYEWEIPEGGCPPGEEPVEAARRELREETGLEAQQIQLIGSAYLSNSVTDEDARLFLATGLKQFDAQPEGTEQLEIRRVPFEEALRMAQNGEITDAISVLTIYRYAQLRAEKSSAITEDTTL